ncbi:MAG: class I SAM-dependent methyltransferase [SAR202 cluster bacterium]|jgi:SAM-dependent methyltransferase|nr:class I SAM-dependent methyltransferase [SAR202 cluster bacterium]MDP6512331.1 class I SAM-dependent methyltransferase [SAR202 cluster bacterium]MDP6716519.1 class I SAM-dependent methyltransferase [SAR202 cluster bacterium]
MRDEQDAYGHEIMDYLDGKPAFEAIERDDGTVLLSGGPQMYFAPFRKWQPSSRKAMRFVRGRVLDVGSGAGRHALHLQERGHEVVCIDNSPLALEVCRRRSVLETRELSVYQVSRSLGIFDTIITMGGNLGLLADIERGKRLLERFDRVTGPKARIIGETRDPHHGDDPTHTAYHESNLKQGKMAGQIRIRVRYRQYVGAWINYMLVSRDELRGVLEGTNWVLSRTIDSDGPEYAAVIEKKS